MSTQEEVYDCAGFGGVDGSNLLHLCFDHHSESNPEVVFYKNTIFLAFCSKKMCFLKMHGASFSFDIMHVQISIQQNNLWGMKFSS